MAGILGCCCYIHTNAVLSRLNVEATESRFEGVDMFGVRLGRQIGDLLENVIGESLGLRTLAGRDFRSVFVTLDRRINVIIKMYSVNVKKILLAFYFL